MKKIKLLPAVIAAASLFTMSTAFAEGSRDLVGRDVLQSNNTYKFTRYHKLDVTNAEEEARVSDYARPYLVYSNSTNARITQQDIIYVYAKEGEVINFGTNVVYDSAYPNQNVRQNLNSFNALRINGLARTDYHQVWTDDDFKGSKEFEDPYKYGTIAVMYCGNDKDKIPNSTDFTAPKQAPDIMKSDFVLGDTINYVSEEYEDDINKTVYLFTAYSDRDSQMFLTEEQKQEKAKGTKGYIANILKEAAGPNGVIPYTAGANGSPTTDGYNPLTFKVNRTGTYAFRFFPNNVEGPSDMKKSQFKFHEPDNSVGSTAEYFSYDRNAPNVALWDITVSSNNKALRGRVWTDMLHLNMGNMDVGIGSHLYILTKDGFEYEVDFNGIHPYGFTFFSNSRGTLLKTTDGDGKEVIQSFDHSFYSFSTGVEGMGDPPKREDISVDKTVTKREVLMNTTPTELGKDFNHKIFFNRPHEDVLTAYTDDGVIVSDDDLPNIPGNYKDGAYTISYTGEGLNSYNKDDKTVPIKKSDNTDEHYPCHFGTEGVGGYFTVRVAKEPGKENVTESNTFSVKLDFSEYRLDEDDYSPVTKDNGEWKMVSEDTASPSKSQIERENIVILSSNDFELVDNDTYYECKLRWSGRDAYDNVVPPGTYTQIVTSYWKSGTAHFPLLDVEYAPHGIKLKMLNEISLQDNTSYDTVYYNISGRSCFGETAWYFNEQTSTGFAPSPYADITLLGDQATVKNAVNGLSSNFGVKREDGVLPSTPYKNDEKWKEVLPIKHVKYENGVATGDTRMSSPGDRTAIDLWMRYATKPEETVLAIGVLPGVHVGGPITPYVSFVGETENQKIFTPIKNQDGSNLRVGTHVGYYKSVNSYKADGTVNSGVWNYVEFPDEHGSDKNGNHFGNTITTEFVAGVTLDPNSGADTYNNVSWTIKIPTSTTYIKAEKDIRDTFIDFAGMRMKAGVLLTDSDNTTEIGSPNVNEGSIYVVNQFFVPGSSMPQDTGTMHFKYKLPVDITGKTKCVFGLVIDNMYAPQAVATDIIAGQADSFDGDEKYFDLNSNSAAVWATGTNGNNATAENYYKNDNNKYWEHDPENTGDDSDSSETDKQ